MVTSTRRAVAAVPGGLDGTRYLARRLARKCEERATTFACGQKGSAEVGAARSVLADLAELAKSRGWGSIAERGVVDFSFMRDLRRARQLTDDSVGVEGLYSPTVVVPTRNVVMLAIASAYAYTILE